ncbi:MAG: ATP-binding protein, partial [Oscillospiraceae bacterium]
MIERIARPLYMAKIRPFIGQTEVVKIVTGLRRSGKSVFLDLIKDQLRADGVPDETILSFNFENLQLREYKDGHRLHDFLKAQIDALGGRVYLFLDEVQEVQNWEVCINSLRVNSDVDIYLTGSNAKMLAGEYATVLAGRYIEVQMYPFSFSEFCSALKLQGAQASEAEYFQKYLLMGGMPFAVTHLESGDTSTQYLSDIYTSVVIKDIMKRNSFRDVDLLERIITYVIANIGRTFSATSISKFLKSEHRKVAPETVLNYLRGCEEAYLFSRAGRMDLVGKKILQVNEKYYVTDHGLREAVYGGNQRDIELVLENIVYFELLRRGYKVTVGRMGETEIDFVCDKGAMRIYVQVCYLLADEQTVAREFGAYAGIPD